MPLIRGTSGGGGGQSVVKQELTNNATTTTTLNNDTTLLVVNPSAGSFTSLALTMPAAPTDGQVITFSFGGTLAGLIVNDLDMLPNSGQSMLHQPSNLEVYAGESIMYQYSTTGTVWRRIGYFKAELVAHMRTEAEGGANALVKKNSQGTIDESLLPEVVFDPGHFTGLGTAASPLQINPAILA